MVDTGIFITSSPLVSKKKQNICFFLYFRGLPISFTSKQSVVLQVVTTKGKSEAGLTMSKPANDPVVMSCTLSLINQGGLKFFNSAVFKVWIPFLVT